MDKFWIICKRCSLRVRGHIIFLTIFEGDNMSFAYNAFHAHTAKTCWGTVDQMDLFALLLQGRLKSLNGIEDLVSAMATPELLEGLGVLEKLIPEESRQSRGTSSATMAMGGTLLSPFVGFCDRQETKDDYEDCSFSSGASEGSGFEDVGSPLSTKSQKELKPSPLQKEIGCGIRTEKTERSLKDLMRKDCDEKSPRRPRAAGIGLPPAIGDSRSSNTSSPSLRKHFSFPDDSRNRAPSDSVGSSQNDEQSPNKSRRCHSWNTSRGGTSYNSAGLSQVPSAELASDFCTLRIDTSNLDDRGPGEKPKAAWSTSPLTSRRLMNGTEGHGTAARSPHRRLKVCNVEGNLLNVAVEDYGDTEVRIVIEPDIQAVLNFQDVERYSGEVPGEAVPLRDHTIEFLFKIIPAYLEECEPKFVETLKNGGSLSQSKELSENLKVDSPLIRSNALRERFFWKGKEYEICAWIGSRGTLEVECTNCQTSQNKYGSFDKSKFKKMFPTFDSKAESLIDAAANNLESLLHNIIEDETLGTSFFRQGEASSFVVGKKYPSRHIPAEIKRDLNASLTSQKSVPKLQDRPRSLCEKISSPFTGCRKRLHASRKIIGTSYYASYGNCSMTCINSRHENMSEASPHPSSAPASFREFKSNKRFNSPVSSAHIHEHSFGRVNIDESHDDETTE